MAIDKHGLKILSEIVRLIHGLLSSVSYLDYEDLWIWIYEFSQKSTQVNFWDILSG